MISIQEKPKKKNQLLKLELTKRDPKKERKKIKQLD